MCTPDCDRRFHFDDARSELFVGDVGCGRCDGRVVLPGLFRVPIGYRVQNFPLRHVMCQRGLCDNTHLLRERRRCDMCPCRSTEQLFGMAASAPPPACSPAMTAPPTLAAARGSGASIVSLAPTRAPTATANIEATTSLAPTRVPTAAAHVSAAPSRSPTKSPTRTPSKAPSRVPSMMPSRASSPSRPPSLPPTITLKPSEEGEIAWQETDLDPAPNAASRAGRQKFAVTAITMATICMVFNLLYLLWW